MVDSAATVIKAIIATLKADTVLAGVVAERIYSDVPQDEEFPYVVVGIASEPFAANDFSGQTHTVRIQTFSRKKTKGEALLARSHALTALDRREDSISLDEGYLVKCEYAGFSDVIPEDDGKTWQAIGELEVIVV